MDITSALNDYVSHRDVEAKEYLLANCMKPVVVRLYKWTNDFNINRMPSTSWFLYEVSNADKDYLIRLNYAGLAIDLYGMCARYPVRKDIITVANIEREYLLPDLELKLVNLTSINKTSRIAKIAEVNNIHR